MENERSLRKMQEDICMNGYEVLTKVTIGSNEWKEALAQIKVAQTGLKDMMAADDNYLLNSNRQAFEEKRLEVEVSKEEKKLEIEMKKLEIELAKLNNELEKRANEEKKWKVETGFKIASLAVSVGAYIIFAIVADRKDTRRMFSEITNGLGEDRSYFSKEIPKYYKVLESNMNKLTR